MSSVGHMLMEYPVYPLLPTPHAIELAFEVVFTLKCFIVLLCLVYCVPVESVAIIFVDVYLFHAICQASFV